MLPRHGSILAQRLSGVFIILLFCLLAWLACEPDVLRNPLAVNYFVSIQEAAWKKNSLTAMS